ncbi:MAG TPA: ImmA/IrrE family metallo-endopeptidase [Candidatus Acidoferrum sp.]|nr:ImmA/IrrE family metallo-endopeptidase [Candidatus Acidoferrum sp.]
MKFFFCALLLSVGFHESPKNLCGGLPTSSSFPHLSTDTVGALPPDETSNALRRLFGEAIKSTPRPIRFTQLPPGVTNTSAVEATANEDVIALRTNLEKEQRENAIAHELSHIVLQGKGFAAEVQVPDGAPGLMRELGFTITSCVDDALIDKRMLKEGFRPQVLNHDSAEQLRLNPPHFPAELYNDEIFRDGNALLIVCFSFRKRYQGDEIESSWNKLQPDIVTRAHVLKAQIGDIACVDAATCLARKKRIRDVLGYPITFCDPLTGQNE